MTTQINAILYAARQRAVDAACRELRCDEEELAFAQKNGLEEDVYILRTNGDRSHVGRIKMEFQNDYTIPWKIKLCINFQFNIL